MSNLISRLSELRSQYNCFEESEREAYHTLSEAIEALSAQKTGKLIPCSERLPEEKTDVLIQFKQNMIVGFWENLFGDDVTWYANSDDGFYTDCKFGEPIAWMPLPEPYTEEEQ